MRARTAVAASAKAGLSVSDLAVQYGGVRAVDGVSLSAPMARITGLIGPNGAGKTTTFNACSGLLKPTAGVITLHEREVTGIGPAGRSRYGLGRTFQKAELVQLAERARERRARPGVLHGRGQPLDPAHREPP